MCFKCNQVGHQAKDCTASNVVTCNKCGQAGHKENRCLKVWNQHKPQAMKFARCIECGKPGHFKCTQEKESLKIKIPTKVLGNLDEFIKKMKGKEVDSFDYINSI